MCLHVITWLFLKSSLYLVHVLISIQNDTLQFKTFDINKFYTNNTFSIKPLFF